MFGAYYTQSRILRWFWRLVILGFPLAPRSISRWPEAFESISKSSSVVLLDMEMFSIACMVGGTNWGRYIMSLAVFPLGPLWLLVCFTSSRRLNKKTQVGWFFSTRQVKVFRFYQIHRASVFSFSIVSRTWFLTCPLSPSPPLAPPRPLSHPLSPSSWWPIPHIPCHQIFHPTWAVRPISCLPNPKGRIPPAIFFVRYIFPVVPWLLPLPQPKML